MTCSFIRNSRVLTLERIICMLFFFNFQSLLEAVKPGYTRFYSSNSNVLIHWTALCDLTKKSACCVHLSSRVFTFFSSNRKVPLVFAALPSSGQPRRSSQYSSQYLLKTSKKQLIHFLATEKLRPGARLSKWEIQQKSKQSGQFRSDFRLETVVTRENYLIWKKKCSFWPNQRTRCVQCNEWSLVNFC